MMFTICLASLPMWSWNPQRGQCEKKVQTERAFRGPLHFLTDTFAACGSNKPLPREDWETVCSRQKYQHIKPACSLFWGKFDVFYWVSGWSKTVSTIWLFYWNLIGWGEGGDLTAIFQPHNAERERWSSCGRKAEKVNGQCFLLNFQASNIYSGPGIRRPGPIIGK